MHTSTYTHIKLNIWRNNVHKLNFNCLVLFCSVFFIYGIHTTKWYLYIHNYKLHTYFHLLSLITYFNLLLQYHMVNDNYRCTGNQIGRLVIGLSAFTCISVLVNRNKQTFLPIFLQTNSINVNYFYHLLCSRVGVYTVLPI